MIVFMRVCLRLFVFGLMRTRLLLLYDVFDARAHAHTHARTNIQQTMQLNDETMDISMQRYRMLKWAHC